MKTTDDKNKLASKRITKTCKECNKQVIGHATVLSIFVDISLLQFYKLINLCLFSAICMKGSWQYIDLKSISMYV
jgi:hypothetical protein